VASRLAEWVELVDGAIFDAVVARRRRSLDVLFLPAAYAGAGGAPWIALVLLLRLRSGRVRVVPSIGGVAGAWLTAQALKRLTNRTRPCHADDGVALVRCPDGSSLPSDQAASAFAGAVVVSSSLPELGPLAYGAASVTAAARVYTGVHFPADVVAGAVIGGCVGRLAVAAASRIELARRIG
jgi:undecaprenyl-diphosphatase